MSEFRAIATLVASLSLVLLLIRVSARLRRSWDAAILHRPTAFD
jgi:hypothetical protein